MTFQAIANEITRISEGVMHGHHEAGRHEDVHRVRCRRDAAIQNLMKMAPTRRLTKDEQKAHYKNALCSHDRENIPTRIADMAAPVDAAAIRHLACGIYNITK